MSGLAITDDVVGDVQRPFLAAAVAVVPEEWCLATQDLAKRHLVCRVSAMGDDISSRDHWPIRVARIAAVCQTQDGNVAVDQYLARQRELERR